MQETLVLIVWLAVVPAAIARFGGERPGNIALAIVYIVVFTTNSLLFSSDAIDQGLLLTILLEDVIIVCVYSIVLL